jgi:hypothetical protein
MNPKILPLSNQTDECSIQLFKSKARLAFSTGVFPNIYSGCILVFISLENSLVPQLTLFGINWQNLLKLSRLPDTRHAKQPAPTASWIRTVTAAKKKKAIDFTGLSRAASFPD